MNRYGRGRAAVLGAMGLALVALCACLGLWAARGDRAAASPGNEIAVFVPLPSAAPCTNFEVNIDITEADTPYQGYQARLRWDPDIVEYVSIEYTGLGSMVLESEPIVDEDSVCFGAARVSGTTYDIGTAAVVTLHCLSEGSSYLHLMTLAEDPSCGTTLLEDWTQTIPTTLVDHFIECAAPTPTPTPIPDTDGDGCTDDEELDGAPWPKPGSTGPYDPLAWHDFYDVPVPSLKVDVGTKNDAITLGDVLAVLDYVGAFDGDGGDYDVDLNANGMEDGIEYDRSPSAEPNPPWDAGPPNGAINMQDVLAALSQVGLDCGGAP